MGVGESDVRSKEQVLILFDPIFPFLSMPVGVNSFNYKGFLFKTVASLCSLVRWLIRIRRSLPVLLFD